MGAYEAISPHAILQPHGVVLMLSEPDVPTPANDNRINSSESPCLKIGKKTNRGHNSQGAVAKEEHHPKENFSTKRTTIGMCIGESHL